MGKREEFNKMMGKIIKALSEGGSSSAAAKTGSQITAKQILSLLMNLSQQIREQGDALGKAEERTERLERNLRLLIKDLVLSGQITVGERRKLLKRNTLTQDALINLLEKKKILSKRALLEEIKRCRQKQGCRDIMPLRKKPESQEGKP